MPTSSPAATAAPRAARTPLNLGYLLDNTAPRMQQTPGRQCDVREGHCLVCIAAQAAPGRQPIRSREAELEATVADRLRAAIAELQAAQGAALAVGYGDQFREELNRSIDQVEFTRRMLS